VKSWEVVHGSTSKKITKSYSDKQLVQEFIVPGCKAFQLQLKASQQSEELRTMTADIRL
jgi:hypothetical protein